MLAPEPPVRLQATFYEPGDPSQVIAELRALGDVVVAVGAPARARSGPATASWRSAACRRCASSSRAASSTRDSATRYLPAVANGARHGQVEDGAFRRAAVFETNPDGVFAALQGRRVPAKRHPLGIQRRIQELVDDHVIDEGGNLWHRRIEEIEAAGAALAAHRYAVGHAYWLGDPAEGVVVLPGARVPKRFSADGVLPDVPRAKLGS